jgi:hypothetical protein
MADEDFTIKLSRDQALVLSDWFYKVMGTEEFDSLVNRTDRAVWAPLHTISGVLETTLVEVFIPDYGARLDAARERLLDTLGDLGRPPADEEPG